MRQTINLKRRARLSCRALEGRLAPANLFVSNNLDSGPGSFRQAILDANFFSDADTITFSNFFNTPQVITLQSELPIVGRAVTIVGTGADKCIVDGNESFTLLRMTHFAAEPATTFSVSGITFRNGANATNIGGVALGADTVTLDGVRILDSTGASGGLYVSGTKLTLEDCEVSGNAATTQFGGGLQGMSGSVLAQRSTFANNSAGSGGGGGLYMLAGSLTMENCTVSGNKSTSVGGGLIVGTSATATLTHCTITDNTAGAGGGVRVNGSLAMTNCVLSGNTGTSAFPDAHGTVTLDHSALGSKSGATVVDKGGNLYGAALKLAPLSANGGFAPTHALLAGSPAMNAGVAVGGFTADQRSVAHVGLPDLGAFEAVAPSAKAAPIPTVTTPIGVVTIPITYSDDAAIDPATVGAGDIRVNGANAYNALAQFVSFTPSADGKGGTAVYHLVPPGGGWNADWNGKYTVSVEPGQVFDTHGHAAVAETVGGFNVLFSRTFVVTNLADSGAGSLRQAVLDSDTTVNGLPDTITFAPGLTGTITLTSGELAHTDAVTVNGPGADKLTISGGGTSRIFNHESGPAGYWLVLNGLTLADAYAPSDGGAIRMGDEILTLNKCVFVNNSMVSGAGGAVAFVGGQGGTLTVNDCTFTANVSDGGGAIYMKAPNASTAVTRSTFDGNVGWSGGGAIYVADGGSLSVLDSTLSANTALGNGTVGGAVFFSGKVGSFTVRNSTLSGNSASGPGGGIAFYGADGALTVQNSTITANSSADKAGGGGISSNNELVAVNLESSILALNLAPNSPNGDYRSPGTVSVKSSAPGTTKAGGGTYIDLGGNLSPSADLKLSPLADNGGPTQTHAVLAGSPCLNAGTNPSGLSFDQRGRQRANGVVDMGSFEAQLPTAKVVVNDGAAQRSMVTKLTVTFSDPITFPAGAAAAFSLTRTGPSGAIGPINLNVAPTGNSVNITFAPGGLVGIDLGGSLLDGTYTLGIDASKVAGAGGALDGNGDGVGGDSFASPNNGPGRLFRFFGDADGDGDVDAVDFGAMRFAFGGSSNLAFDHDGDGDVDALDFGQFRPRFGLSI